MSAKWREYTRERVFASSGSFRSTRGGERAGQTHAAAAEIFHDSFRVANVCFNFESSESFLSPSVREYLTYGNESLYILTKIASSPLSYFRIICLAFRDVAIIRLLIAPCCLEITRVTYIQCAFMCGW